MGLDGALLTHIAIRLENADGTRGQIAFVPGLNLGSSARENVSALSFWRALQEAERVELAPPSPTASSAGNPTASRASPVFRVTKR